MVLAEFLYVFYSITSHSPWFWYKAKGRLLTMAVNQSIVSYCPHPSSPYTLALCIPSAWNDSTVVNFETEGGTQKNRVAH